MSLYNTRGRKAVNEKMGIDVSKDHEVSLQPRLRSSKVIPTGYPDWPESCDAPFSQSLNSKEFQDSPHEQTLKTVKSSKKFSTQCVVTPESKKVMAPRNLESSTKTPEKDPTEDLKEIDDKQLTTNVTVDLLDELIKEYHPDVNLWSVDIRIPNSSKGKETENTNSAAEELHIPWTQSFQSSDQLLHSDLKNLQVDHASLASTSTENCPQAENSGADLSEMLKTLETGSAGGSEMMLSPESGFKMLQSPEASFKDDAEISPSQGAVYQLENELLLLQHVQKAALELDGEMSEMEARFIEAAPAKNCREDAECSTTTELLDHHMGFDYESVMDQEVTCEDLPEEIPRDTFAIGDIVYGNGKAVEDLAQSHGHHLLKTGVQGVYTDKIFEALRLETQNPDIIQSTKLGQGSFGVVVKCVGPNLLVFVKKKVTGKFHQPEAIFTNRAMHPNIIKSHGLMVNFGKVEILMDFAGQSLLSMVNTMKPLQESIIWSLTLDLCSGLAYLESENVVHFDIKPENLFVQEDEKNGYLLKIGDFGSARMPGAQTEMTAWTAEYCTPEMALLFLKRNYPGMLEKLGISLSEQEIEGTLQPKTDMFSAGLVVLFMYVGDHVLNQFITRAKLDITDNEKRKHILLVLSRQQNLDSLLIPESIGQEMRRVLQGMLKYDVKERSSANDTMMLFKSTAMLCAKDQNTSLPERAVEENVIAQKKIQSARPRARRGRGKKRQEAPSSTPQMKMTKKSEEILAENPQLKKRMVKDELKRKLLKQPSVIPDKVMKLMEPDLEMRESSQSGSVSDWRQVRMSVDGNQQTESLQGGDRAGLLTNGYQTGSSTPGSQIGLSAQGNQTGFLMQEIQVALSTNGNQTGFSNLGGFSEDYLPLEQPFSEVQISENQHPIRQAEDDWSIQESNQEPEPAGNMPNLGCLGFD